MSSTVKYDTPEEVERIWRDFDQHYLFFQSNGLYTIIDAVRQYKFTRWDGEQVIITLSYFEGYDGNIFGISIKTGKVISHWDRTKNNIYEFIDQRIIKLIPSFLSIR